MTIDQVSVFFPKLDHFWFDAGLVGFFTLANAIHQNDAECTITKKSDGITILGTETGVHNFLEGTYQHLLAKYYNTSSEKQRAENSNFYYDSKKGHFVRFPKAKPRGIAGIIFSQPPRKTKEQIKVNKKEIIEDGKKVASITLPDEYSDIQPDLERFLQEANLKLSANNLLLDGPNAFQPKVTIDVRAKKPKGVCSICGVENHSFSEISGTIFPLITGTSGVLSFFSDSSSPQSVCWKCDYISKFVPACGFYLMNNEQTHMYFPFSPSLSKMLNIWDTFNAITISEPELFKNFSLDLGNYFQRPFENFFAFMYTLYSLFSKKSANSDSDDDILDISELLGIVSEEAPLIFYILVMEKLGDSQIGKLLWPYTDTSYLFRLFNKLEQEKTNLKKCSSILIDPDPQTKDKNKTLTRNRIFEKILKKQSVEGVAQLRIPHNIFILMSIKSTLPYYVQHILDVSYDRSGF